MDEAMDLNAALVRYTHSSIVIWGAAHLDHRMAGVLRRHMANLSNSLDARLFTGYGPLSRFSARIDVAFALDLIKQDLRTDLHIMRDLRNEFAHSPDHLLLTDEGPNKLLRKLSTFGADKSPLDVYFDKLHECDDRLAPTENTQFLVKALQDYTAKHGSLFGESVESSLRRPRPSRGGSGKDEGAQPR